MCGEDSGEQLSFQAGSGDFENLNEADEGGASLTLADFADFSEAHAANLSGETGYVFGGDGG